MVTRGLFLVGVLGGLFSSFEAVGYESRAYEVTESDGVFEVRDYPSVVVAETVLPGEFDDVGSNAFRMLFRYISGSNEPSQEIAMTTPVTQQAKGDRYKVAFLMPSEYPLGSLPAPGDERIEIRSEQGGRFACVRYSGFWSQSNYEKNLSRLQTWISQRGFEVVGEPVWARYDPPFKPWFMRRNEIWLPIAEPGLL